MSLLKFLVGVFFFFLAFAFNFFKGLGRTVLSLFCEAQIFIDCNF